MKLNSKRDFQGTVFILAEKLEDYRTAAIAQAEYWASGVCCRKEPVEEEGVYYIWVGPVRQRKVKTLSHERIRRQRRATRVIYAAA